MSDTVIDFAEASTELETGVSHNVDQDRSVSLPIALMERDIMLYLLILQQTRSV